MKVKRFMVIRDCGNIDFLKVTYENNGIEKSAENIRHYNKTSQSQLDFARECMERFENEFPDWAGVLDWEMIAEDDFYDWYDFPIAS